MCPLGKTIGMMRGMVQYYENARRLILEQKGENKLTYASIV